MFSIINLHGVLNYEHRPVWAFFPTFTFSLDPERTYMWAVPLVVGGGPGQLQQHVAGGHGFTQGPTRSCSFIVGNL